MRAFLAVASCSLLLGTACKDRGGAAPPAGEAKAALGGSCAVQGDCIPGAICQSGTCELPGPCTERTERPSGGPVFAAYAFEKSGFLRALDEYAGGQLRTRIRGSAKDGRRVATEESFGDHPFRMTITSRYDDGNRLVERTVKPEGKPEHKTTWDWSSDAACRDAAPATSSDGKVTVTCDDKGLVAKARQEREAFTRVMTYRRDEQGRLMSLRHELELGDRTMVNGERYLRHADGYLVGKEIDEDGDGTYETRIRQDLSCWKITKSEVTGHPSKPAPLPPPKVREVGALAKAIKGRWKRKGSDTAGIIDLARGVVTIVEDGKEVEHRVRLLEDTADHVTVGITLGGNKWRAVIRSINDRTLSVTDGGKGEAITLVRP